MEQAVKEMLSIAEKLDEPVDMILARTAAKKAEELWKVDQDWRQIVKKRTSDELEERPRMELVIMALNEAIGEKKKLIKLWS